MEEEVPKGSIVSHPARGVRIEIPRNGRLARLCWSHPARGVRIEMIARRRGALLQKSHPARGVRIEIAATDLLNMRLYCRTPQGV